MVPFDDGLGPFAVPMTEPPPQNRETAEKDDGLRRLLTWTFVALVAAVALAVTFAWLARYWFDVPR